MVAYEVLQRKETYTPLQLSHIMWRPWREGLMEADPLNSDTKSGSALSGELGTLASTGESAKRNSIHRKGNAYNVLA
jgi:hypothetical protein